MDNQKPIPTTNSEELACTSKANDTNDKGTLTPNEYLEIIASLKLEKKQLQEQNNELSSQINKLDNILTTVSTITQLDKETLSITLANETILNKIICTLPDLIWLKDANGIYLECNTLFERFFGAKEKDIIGKTDYDFVDKELADSFRANDLQAISLGRSSKNEEWITFSDSGERAYLETIKTPMYDNSGELIGVLGIGRDITNRHKIEQDFYISVEKFKTLFENSIIGKSITTLDGEIHTNDSFAKILGYNLDELNSKTWEQITHPEDIEYNKLQLQLIKTGKIDHSRFEKRYIRKDGSTVWVDLCTTLHRDKEGEPLFFITEIVDINERKLAELEILNSLEEAKRLKKALDTVPSLIFMKNSDGAYTYANEQTLKLLNCTADELNGKDDSYFFSSETKNRIQAIDREVLAGTSSASEIQFQSKSGEMKDYWEIKTPLVNYNNKVIGLIGITTDITVQKKKEEELKNLNERLNLILENNPIAIWDWNIDTNKWYATPKYYTLLGYKPEHTPPDHVLWQNRLHPEDRPVVISKMDEILTRSSCNFSYDARFLHANGTYKWQSVVGNIVEKNVDGKPLRIMGVRIDIDNRKQIEEKLKLSEQKLSSLFSAMTEIVVLHELVFNDEDEPIDYRILDCNNAFISLTKKDKQNIIGKLGTELYNSEKAPFIDDYVTVATTQIPFGFDTYYAPLDKHFLISVISYKKNEFVTIATDISKIQTIQQLLFKKNKELEDYLYITSHDLRSPLVNIQGFSQRLNKHTNALKQLILENNSSTPNSEVDKILSADMPKTLEYVFSNVLKMETLINGILQLSRTDRAQMTIKQIDMKSLFNSIVSTLNYQLQELNARIIIEDISDCYGDENQLNQLFTNLITNAIKYHEPTRQLEIRISSEVKYNKVTYHIQDNGIGITPKYQDKIWNVFYRINPQADIQGDGIGLSLVKRLTEKHMGTAYLKSEENEGCTFSVELPLESF